MLIYIQYFSISERKKYKHQLLSQLYSNIQCTNLFFSKAFKIRKNLHINYTDIISKYSIINT
jgi:hypothetical protein